MSAFNSFFCCLYLLTYAVVVKFGGIQTNKCLGFFVVFETFPGRYVLDFQIKSDQGKLSIFLHLFRSNYLLENLPGRYVLDLQIKSDQGKLVIFLRISFVNFRFRTEKSSKNLHWSPRWLKIYKKYKLANFAFFFCEFFYPREPR